MAVTKATLTELTVEQLRCSKEEAVNLVDIFFEELKQQLHEQQEIAISGFGQFKVLQKKERLGRNPKTGDRMILPARKVISFKHSLVLKDRLNKY